MSSTARQRTCIVCRTTSAKAELIRVVRTPEGQVKLDSTGKANGRGAYVCGRNCFETALEKHRFEGALKMKLNEEDKESLRSQFDELNSEISR